VRGRPEGFKLKLKSRFKGRRWRASGARVSLAVGFLQALDGNVGVDLGGGNAGVTEQGLDAAEVGAGVEHVGGKGMAQLVGADADGDAGVAEVFFEEIADCDGGDAPAALGNEERPRGDTGLGTVFLDGLESRSAYGDDALFAALAQDANGLGERVDMGDIQGDEFREAKATGIEEFQDGGIAGGAPGGGLFFERGAEWGAEEVVHLGDGEDERELAFELG
jgi:hypothetical protein